MSVILTVNHAAEQSALPEDVASAGAFKDPAPVSSNLASLRPIDAQHAFQNYGNRLPVAFSHGRGARLWDLEGKEYLDFLAGIAVTQVGHAHPHVVEAIARQAASVLHVSNYYYIEPQVKLAARLSALTHGYRAFFCNSGTEASEAAIKLARKWQHDGGNAQKFEIVTVWKSFHGRTLGALAATGNAKYHEGFAPLPAGFVHVEFNDLDALREAVGPATAAIFLEPILGESGVLLPSDEFLRGARELCDQHGALLIFDEVQCGNGRTGKFWAHEWIGVRPDILTTAKGLANGVPIGAVLAREEVAAALTPGSHGTTFGGNFLATAAAGATLDVIENEGLMANATAVGAYFQERLNAWGELTGATTEVRGRGLMIGVQMKAPIARELMLTSLEGGLIFNAVGDSILRFLPPLSITNEDVDEAMGKLAAAYASLHTEAGA